jgi:hypothetical protein
MLFLFACVYECFNSQAGIWGREVSGMNEKNELKRLQFQSKILEISNKITEEDTEEIIISLNRILDKDISKSDKRSEMLGHLVVNSNRF